MLHGIDREVLTEKLNLKKPAGSEGISQADVCRKSVQCGGDSKYKGPEICAWHIQRIGKRKKERKERKIVR